MTGEQYAAITHEQLPDIPESNILLEPCRRNTAPCICYVSWKIKHRNPHANIVVTPADHIVADVEGFREAIGEAMEFTAETDAIVTLGIKPSRPETGYGYIEGGASLGSKARRVERFIEKPDRATAEKLVASGKYSWNSGMFLFRAKVFLEELAAQAADIFQAELPPR